MQKLKIRGGKRLVGEVKASGAKNAALPILASALLTADEVELRSVPELADVATMGKLLSGMGASFTRESADRVRIHADNVTSTEAPYDLVRTMRASILVLGPLVARFGTARVSLPGGCAIGARPVDQHIELPEPRKHFCLAAHPAERFLCSVLRASVWRLVKVHLAVAAAVAQLFCEHVREVVRLAPALFRKGVYRIIGFTVPYYKELHFYLRDATGRNRGRSSVAPFF